MIRSAVTIALVPEMRSGPFIFSDDLPSSCQRATDLGFDAVELFYHEATAVNIAELQGLLTNHKLAISAFGTGAGRMKYKLSLTDPDARQRRRAINYITQFIDVAAQFNAPAIIGSMQGRWGEGGVRREQALAWLGEALNELADRAAKHRMPVLYEFLNRYETNLLNNVEQALGFLRTLRTQNIKLLCDLFHMNIEEPDIAASIRYAGDKVGHVHFADTNRHPIGQGHLDMAPIADALDTINYNGFISAEALPLPDSEAAARQTIASFQKYFPR